MNIGQEKISSGLRLKLFLHFAWPYLPSWKSLFLGDRDGSSRQQATFTPWASSALLRGERTLNGDLLIGESRGAFLGLALFPAWRGPNRTLVWFSLRHSFRYTLSKSLNFAGTLRLLFLDLKPIVDCISVDFVREGMINIGTRFFLIGASSTYDRIPAFFLNNENPRAF